MDYLLSLQHLWNKNLPFFQVINMNLLSTAEGLLKRSKLKNVKFIKGDANRRLPFKDNSFSKVLCSDVLEHLDNRNFALKEIYRVLKKGGLLLLVTDNPDTSWKRILRKHGLNYYADADHKYEYPKEEILKALKKNNFDVINIDTVTYNTPLAPFIDITGGVSLGIYKNLRKWRAWMNKKFPNETTGFRIIARKIS